MHLDGIIEQGSGQFQGRQQMKKQGLRPRRGPPEKSSQSRPMRKGPGSRMQPGQNNPSKGQPTPQQPSCDKDYSQSAKNLIALMDQYGVEKSLIMPPPQYPDQKGGYEHTALLKAVAPFKNRLFLAAGGGTLNPIIIGTDRNEVTLEIAQAFEAKANALADSGIKCFGEMTAMHLSMAEHHPYISTQPDHPLFLLLADLSAKHNIPIDLHMEAIPKPIPCPPALSNISMNPDVLPATIPAFEELLSYNRNANIVWQHIGWDNTGGMTPTLLDQLLQKHPNLYLALRVEDKPYDLSGNLMPNRLVDIKGKLYPEWLTFIKKHADRLMIGSDEFVGVPGKTFQKPKSFKSSWGILKQVPNSIAEKIGHSNAAKIYHL